jgi:glycosyltransferase involved in cell wall biosynthesis
MAPAAQYFHVDEVIRPRFYQLHWQPVQHTVPVFLTTSSPSFYKGFEMVIDTARVLTTKGVAFTWLVAGLKEDHSLVKLIRQLKKADDLGALNIRLLGTLGEEELAGHLLTSDAYVQVSHIENSPNSLCEAMLAGMPIIASFAGGTSSLLKDGVHGVLVQDGDPYALAGAMEEVTKYPEQVQSMAAEGRVVARRRHDPEGIARGMLEKYATIIEKHAKKNE